MDYVIISRRKDGKKFLVTQLNKADSYLVIEKEDIIETLLTNKFRYFVSDLFNRPCLVSVIDNELVSPADKSEDNLLLDLPIFE